jgi:hypothetical protein
MVCDKIHVCVTCDKLFKTNHELARHKNRKTKCASDDNNLKEITEQHIFIDIIKQKNIAMAVLNNFVVYHRFQLYLMINHQT